MDMWRAVQEKYKKVCPNNGKLVIQLVYMKKANKFLTDTSKIVIWVFSKRKTVEKLKKKYWSVSVIVAILNSSHFSTWLAFNVVVLGDFLSINYW